jgi:hypothetical protein
MSYSLRPYQQELLNILQDPTCPRFGVITSIPGSGIRHAIEIHIRRVASTSLVLILCPTLVGVHQWAYRLQDAGDTPVAILTGASAALDLLEGQPRRHAGVLVATYARTGHGPSSRALSELDFGLLLHDSPFQRFPNEVERLNSRAGRVIAIVDPSQVSARQPQWPILWDMTSEDLVGNGYPASIDVPYEPTSEETALREEAIGVLREDALQGHTRLGLRSDSIPELHARLLTVASNPSGDEDLSNQAWRLLDRIEGVLAPDSRLVALGRLVERETSEGARCVILAPTRTDAKYIADHLTNTGRAPRALLSAAMVHSDRRSALAALSPGECLIVTHPISESIDDWPTNLTVILWPSPNNQQVLSRLFLATENSLSIKVLELKEIHSPRNLPSKR